MTTALFAAVLFMQLLRSVQPNRSYDLPPVINVCCIQNAGFCTCKSGDTTRNYIGVDLLLLQETFRRLNIMVSLV
jgi:hypothetical protein